ncbi:hypothetical protein GR160_10330 [Flavobacterium sp. Sd200]|uniref:cytochrome c oxidase assembly factor Coa1 family protein n=1 Tax=Flavobacterium sp. Sd200 TaxID=2692211 RepID=UPI00136ABE1A|nr:cytochrome c oxidase assembly factor Coa1 family protein [Flavobacterium sp. Sd200]MXN91623.1 hypothetical protein [Flavobacterium sp. Sd200]
MDNELVQHKSWMQRNIKWFAPVLVLLLLLGSVMFSSVSDAQLGGFANALADEALYNNAVKQAQDNDEVTSVLGNLEPVDQMAIIESDVNYSDNNNAVNLSVRIKGSKAKGRMDVAATKVNNAWQYNAIKIRLKDPKREIVVLED